MIDNKYDDMILPERLGSLFYAIAASDGSVRKEESLEMISMLREQWREHMHRQGLKTISRTFKNHLEIRTDPNTAFEDFMEFKEEHPEIIDEDLIKRILRTANAIAGSFSGKNKSELILLARLGISLRS